MGEGYDVRDGHPCRASLSNSTLTDERSSTITMRPHLILALGLSLTACTTTTTILESEQLEARTARTKLHQISWLSGTWHMAKPEGYAEEKWLPPQGGMMMGLGYTIEGETTKAFEYLRIETREDTLVYVALPQGRGPGVEFYLTNLTNEEALFENPEHDFPKWIRYQRTGPESCKATIGSDTGSIAFLYDQRL